MNKATLRTYIRATVDNTPRSAEAIAALIQEQLPKEKVELNQVYCILLQLENAGIIHGKGTIYVDTPLSYLFYK